MISFGREVLSDYESAVSREFLLTNPIGCYSSSTIIGLNTRKYHGLLVTDRVHLSKLDEEIDGVGLSTNQYRGAIYPEGYRYLESFELYPPTFIYRMDETTVRKKIFLSAGSRTIHVSYIIWSKKPVVFNITPLIAERGVHELRFDYNLSQEKLQNGVRVNELTITSNIEFEEKPDIYWNFNYEWEKRRGYDFEENLYSPGKFFCRIKGEKTVDIIATLERDVDKINVEEIKKLKKIKKPTNPYEVLSLTADSFIAPHSILAGYHWFVESWGRDTFISLPGLLLVRKKFAHARKIFRQYAKCMRNGIIPNILPDRFNSADATLWFVYSLKKYYEYTGDEEFLKEMGPCMEQIVEKYPENKSISMDEDGLIKVSECLTWMDTKFTPRGGKPVEVNALWLNALSAFEELFGIECHSAKIKKNFSKFWNGQGLFDVLEPTDSSIRPNQIFAISLPHRLLSKAKEKKILKVVKKELLTPYGLRTLSASDKNYRGSYTGDESYHNGCVWPWLTGFYITAHMRIYGDADYCKAILQPLLEHLKDAGLGSISEIFDGDAPHRPNGCISQAWSVAEVLRCMHEDLELI